ARLDVGEVPELRAVADLRGLVDDGGLVDEETRARGREPLGRSAALQRALAGLEDAQHLDTGCRVGERAATVGDAAEEVLALAAERLARVERHRLRRRLPGDRAVLDPVDAVPVEDELVLAGEVVEGHHGALADDRETLLLVRVEPR